MSWRTDLLGLGSSDTSSPGQCSCGTKEAHTVPPSKLVLPWVSNNSSLRAYLVSHVVTTPLLPWCNFHMLPNRCLSKLITYIMIETWYNIYTQWDSLSLKAHHNEVTLEQPLSPPLPSSGHWFMQSSLDYTAHWQLCSWTAGMSRLSALYVETVPFGPYTSAVATDKVSLTLLCLLIEPMLSHFSIFVFL